MSTLPAEVFGVWVHSHEEDTPEFSVYRPRGYTFPRARGRQAFEIRKDGTYIRYDAPADRSRSTVGHWEAEAPDRIRVSLPGEKTGRTLSLDTSEKGVLKVRR